MGFSLDPGTLCDSADGRVLLLGRRDASRFLAVPYPAGESLVPRVVDASSLAPAGRDLACARVAAQRLSVGMGVGISAQANRPAQALRPIQKAMVLCAGLGLRLRPLTLRFPKPALPFFGGPLLRYSFALLGNAGVTSVVVNSHHLPELLAATAQREAAAQGLALESSHESEIQGTAGGVREAARHLRGAPFLLLNGDAFLAFSLSELIAHHQASGACATLAVMPMPEGESYAAVEADAGGAVHRIAGRGLPTEGGLTRWHFIGAHVIEPTLLDQIGAGPEDINRDVYPRMVARGLSVRVCPVRVGAWADMGTPQRYLQACEDVMTGLCDLSALGDRGPISAATARALRSSGVAGRTVVDGTARVSAQACLEASQVGPETTVGAACLRRTAVLPGTAICDGEELQEYDRPRRSQSGGFPESIDGETERVTMSVSIRVQAKSNPEKARAALKENLSFGRVFADLMFTARHEAGQGWQEPEVVPFGPLTLSPAARVLHYSQEIFEGLKAYAWPNGEVALFRPELNAERFKLSARRLMLPEVPVELQLAALETLVDLLRDWVPQAPGSSLYLRPTLIGVDPFLGVGPSASHLFFVIASPVGSYFSADDGGVAVYIESEQVRAFPGGVGTAKTGGNYAAGLQAQMRAKARGFDQVLFLDGAQRRYLEELNGMNVFVVQDGVAFTPELGDTVLDGVTRRSILELSRSPELGIRAEERPLDVRALRADLAGQRVSEAFACGTGAVVTPITAFGIGEERLTVGSGQIGPMTRKIHDTLTGIQTGRVPDTKGWVRIVKRSR